MADDPKSFLKNAEEAEAMPPRPPSPTSGGNF